MMECCNLLTIFLPDSCRVSMTSESVRRNSDGRMSLVKTALHESASAVEAFAGVPLQASSQPR